MGRGRDTNVSVGKNRVAESAGDFYCGCNLHSSPRSRVSRERNPRREWPDSFLRRPSKNMRIDPRPRTAGLFSRGIEITENLKGRPIKSTAKIGVVIYWERGRRRKCDGNLPTCARCIILLPNFIQLTTSGFEFY